MKVYFFDSHGDLWVTCGADDPDAQAFGPAGTAKEFHVHSECYDSPWECARAYGILNESGCGDFDTVDEHNVLAGDGEDPIATFFDARGEID